MHTSSQFSSPNGKWHGLLYNHVLQSKCQHYALSGLYLFEYPRISYLVIWWVQEGGSTTHTGLLWILDKDVNEALSFVLDKRNGLYYTMTTVLAVADVYTLSCVDANRYGYFHSDEPDNGRLPRYTPILRLIFGKDVWAIAVNGNSRSFLVLRLGLLHILFLILLHPTAITTKLVSERFRQQKGDIHPRLMVGSNVFTWTLGFSVRPLLTTPNLINLRIVLSLCAMGIIHISLWSMSTQNTCGYTYAGQQTHP